MPLPENSTINFCEVSTNKKTKILYVSDQHLTNDAFDKPLIKLIINHIKKLKKQGYNVLLASLGDAVDQEMPFPLPKINKTTIKSVQAAILAREERIAKLVGDYFKQFKKAGAKIIYILRGNEDEKRYNNFGYDPLNQVKRYAMASHCDLIVNFCGTPYVLTSFHRISLNNRKSMIPTKQAAENYFKRNGKVNGIDASIIIEGHIHDSGIVHIQEPSRSTFGRGYSNKQYYVSCPSHYNTIQYGSQSHSTKRGLSPVDTGFVEITFEDKVMKTPKIITSSDLLGLGKTR